MLLDCSDTGKIKIDMRQYLKQIFEEVTDEFDGIATSLAANHMFDINDDCKKLSEEKEISSITLSIHFYFYLTGDVQIFRGYFIFNIAR